MKVHVSNGAPANERPQVKLRVGFEATIVVIFVLSAVFTLLRVTTTPAPIYASDEYAYLKSGLDFGRSPATEQRERDPGLQQLSNYVYSWIVSWARRIFGDPTPAIRALNFAGYFLGIPIIGCWLLRRCSGGSTYLWFIGLLALLPASVFVLSPMPEILFATGYTIIAVATVMITPTAPLGSSLFAGAALGILAYVKPHAVAAIVGFGAFFTLYSTLNWKKGKRGGRLLPLTFVAGLAVGIFFVNATVLKQPSFAPKFVGNLYAGAVQSAFSLAHFLKGIETITKYALLHGLVLIVFFPLAFVGFIDAALRLIGRKKEISCNAFDNLALLTTFCAGAFIVMIAHYTYYVGAGGGSQSNRLLGRYLIVIFPSLLLITCHVLSVVRRQSEGPIGRYLHSRWVICAFIFTAVGTAWLLCHSKLFPWDYPELFSLYSSPNSYWGWVAPVSLRTPILTFGLIVLLACFIRPHLTPALLGLGQAGFFAASLFLTTFWQETHAREHQSLAAAGHILRTEVGPNAEDLLLVGSERYGDVSYILCGLLANPWVKILPNDSELAASMVPSGVKVVATLGSYNVKFPFVSYTENGALRVYGLDASTIHTYSALAPFCDEKELVIHTGNTERNAALFGFNPPAPWGTRTSDDDAVILLPCRIKGHLHLKFRSWVQTADRSNVALTVGDAVLSFQPGTTPAEFDLPVSLTSPADRIRVHYPATRANSWERRIGVALSEITISPNH